MYARQVRMLVSGLMGWKVIATDLLKHTFEFAFGSEGFASVGGRVGMYVSM